MLTPTQTFFENLEISMTDNKLKFKIKTGDKILGYTLRVTEEITILSSQIVMFQSYELITLLYHSYLGHFGYNRKVEDLEFSEEIQDVITYNYTEIQKYLKTLDKVEFAPLNS